MDTNYDPTQFDPLASDNDFLKNLREALQQSYEAGLKNLENQRKLDQSKIMTDAAKAGVMFSNIPQRMKIQYDTNTFMPGQVKLRQSYQTGLDSLRNAGISAANNAAYYQQMIDHYNTMPTSNTGGGSINDILNLINGTTGDDVATGDAGSTTSGASQSLNTLMDALAQVKM